MLSFAYIECGLSIDGFFGLSWYEWSLEIGRVQAKKKRDFDIWEGQAALMRENMVLMAEFKRDKKKRPLPFKGSDFIKLSFDSEEKPEEVKRLSPEEVDAKYGKYIKKNGG